MADKDTLEPLGYETKREKKGKRDGGKSGGKGRDQQRRVRAPPAGKVVVVGAGPAGLAAASALKVGNHFRRRWRLACGRVISCLRQLPLLLPFAESRRAPPPVIQSTAQRR
jgi:hypothetical protein